MYQSIIVWKMGEALYKPTLGAVIVRQKGLSQNTKKSHLNDDIAQFLGGSKILNSKQGYGRSLKKMNGAGLCYFLSAQMGIRATKKNNIKVWAPGHLIWKKIY